MQDAETTQRVEDYLEAIYNGLSEGQVIIAARLAERINRAPPTVKATLQRMARQGLIEFSPRKEIKLTAKGEALAAKIIRRHRLTERFLNDVLGFDWVEAHEQAAALEHGITPKMEERMAAVLGNPTTCPHGNPIPGMGWEPAPGAFRLDQAHEGDEIAVERISEESEWDPRLLTYLEQHGLVPGHRFRVLQVAPFAGTMLLHDGEREISLGLRAAGQISVYPAPEPATSEGEPIAAPVGSGSG